MTSARTLAFAALAAGVAACGADAPGAPAGIPATVAISLADPATEVAQYSRATAVVLDQYGEPVAAGPASFASSDPRIAAVSPTTGLILGVSPGTAEITATVAGVTGRERLAVFLPSIRINEVEPDGDAAGGWVELHNPTDADFDLSAWSLTHSNRFRKTVLPLGTVIPARGYLVVDEPGIHEGLARADGLRLFSRFSVEVDAFFWTQDATTTYGRCPDGAGDLVNTAAPTRGAGNLCR